MFYGINAAPSESKRDAERAGDGDQREMRSSGHVRRKCRKLGTSAEGRGKRVSPERMITEKSAFAREGRVAVSGPHNRSSWPEAAILANSKNVVGT